jgi:hypothetical protein
MNSNDILRSAFVVSVAVISTPQMAFASGGAQISQDEQSAFDSYVNSGYGFCDAKKIAHVWGESDAYQGKLILGNKVSAGLEDLADTDIATTSANVSCSWWETELSYEDAEQLGQYWGESVDDAKAKAAGFMSEIGYRKFVEQMGHTLASVNSDGHDDDITSTALDAFADSGYGYCDAKKIAHVWGESDPYEGKIILGNKVLGDLEHLADADIASTAGKVMCEWWEAGLSYEDAVALGEYWGRSVEDSKLKVADLMSDMGYRQFRSVMSGAFE